MKRWIVAVVFVGLLLASGLGIAHEGESHGEEQGLHSVTGEVVDLACYLGHGEMGPAHRDCAQKCIASGLPVGIKSGDEIFIAITSEHGTANATLASLAAKQVTAEGVVTERNGVHLIAIKKVTLKE